MSKKRVCLVSLYSYPLFNPSCGGSFGGSEVRVAIIARGLARLADFEVSLLVFDHGQEDGEVIDNVTIRVWRGRRDPALTKEEGKGGDRLGYLARRLWRAMVWRLEWIHAHRFVYWPVAYLRRWLQPILGRLLEPRPFEKVDADLYLVPGNNEITAEVAFSSRDCGRKVILLAGSDMDYDPAYRLDPGGRNVYGTPHHLMAYANSAVDAHIVQSTRQAESLASNYGRRASIVRNPIDLSGRISVDAGSMRDLLWIGKSDPVKRPELMLEMASRLPQYSVTMVLNLANRLIHESILREAQALPNLEIVEYVPFAGIESYFACHRILINTSTIEGFPNTFLQSMKYGHPIATLEVDPESIISRHGCGICGDGDFGRMVELTGELLSQPQKYAEMGRNAEHYVGQFHDQEQVVARYAEIIGSLIAADTSARD